MGKIGSYNWKGESEEVYDFEAYTLDTKFKDGIEGNYIFAKPIEGSDNIRAVYIGEGILKDRIEFRIGEGQIQKKGCDRICIMVNNNVDSRKRIEKDLLSNNPLAYEPTGCNIKIDG